MYICSECREEVAPGVKRCPNCGYHPSKEGYWTLAVIQIIGLLFTVTVIGAIVGVPIQYWSYKKMKAKRNASVGIEVSTEEAAALQGRASD